MRSRWSARITNICNFCPAVPSWPSTVLERLWGSQVMPCVSLSAVEAPVSQIVIVPAADTSVAGSLDAQETAEVPGSTVDGSAVDSSSPAEPPAATPEEAAGLSVYEGPPAAAPVSAPSAAAGTLQAAAADGEPAPIPQAAAVQGAVSKAAATKQVVLGPCCHDVSVEGCEAASQWWLHPCGVALRSAV